MIDQDRVFDALRDLAWATRTCIDRERPLTRLSDVFEGALMVEAGDDDLLRRDALLAAGANIVARLVELAEAGVPAARPLGDRINRIARDEVLAVDATDIPAVAPTTTACD